MKLQRHFESKHPQFINKDKNCFKRHANAFEAHKRIFSATYYSFSESPESIVRSFFFDRQNNETT
jgi:hypothetical protein